MAKATPGAPPSGSNPQFASKQLFRGMVLIGSTSRIPNPWLWVRVPVPLLAIEALWFLILGTESSMATGLPLGPIGKTSASKQGRSTRAQPWAGDTGSSPVEAFVSYGALV